MLNTMAKADMVGELVFLDHLFHVFHDFIGGRDRRAHPGLEAVSEREEI